MATLIKSYFSQVQESTGKYIYTFPRLSWTWTRQIVFSLLLWHQRSPTRHWRDFRSHIALNQFDPLPLDVNQEKKRKGTVGPADRMTRVGIFETWGVAHAQQEEWRGAKCTAPPFPDMILWNPIYLCVIDLTVLKKNLFLCFLSPTS